MQRVFVRRHPRQTPKARVRAAEKVLRRTGAAGDLGSVCYVLASPEDSQVLPPDGEEFRAGRCSVVNIEPSDLRDEIEAAATLHHESVHTRQIKEHGLDGVSNAKEIEAHEETILFLKKWRAKENGRKVWCTDHKRQEPIKDRIPEVIAEERESISVLRKEN
jgi:uncharacterized protein YbaR (Trm112 family)